MAAPAAPGPGIQVEGAVELRKALKRMSADMKDLTRVNRAAAEQVASAARARAPVHEGTIKRKGKVVPAGRLKKSIKAGASQKGGYVKAGSKLVVYAGPIHFGWHRRHIVPQPFIYDALDERRGEVVHLYEKRVADLVERVGRETP